MGLQAPVGFPGDMSRRERVSYVIQIFSSCFSLRHAYVPPRLSSRGFLQVDQRHSHPPLPGKGLFDLQKSNILHPQSCVGNLYNEEALVANLGFKVRLFVPLFLSKTNNPGRYLGVGCKC